MSCNIKFDPHASLLMHINLWSRSSCCYVVAWNLCLFRYQKCQVIRVCLKDVCELVYLISLFSWTGELYCNLPASCVYFLNWKFDFAFLSMSRFILRDWLSSALPLLDAEYLYLAKSTCYLFMSFIHASMPLSNCHLTICCKLLRYLSFLYTYFHSLWWYDIISHDQHSVSV